MPAPESHRAAARVMALFPNLLRAAFSEVRRQWHPSHYVLLGLVERRSPTLSEIAEYQGVSLPAASSAVSTLEDYGWVTRQRDEIDRRVVHVLLTEAGQTAYQQMNLNILARIAAHLEQLSPEDLEAAQRGADLLIRALSVDPQVKLRIKE